MMNAFKITLGILLGIGASLFVLILAVLALQVAIIGAFTVYHLTHS